MKDDSKILSIVIVSPQFFESRYDCLGWCIDCFEFYSKKILNIHATTSMSQTYNHLFFGKLFIWQVPVLAGTILTKLLSLSWWYIRIRLCLQTEQRSEIYSLKFLLNA